MSEHPLAPAISGRHFVFESGDHLKGEVLKETWVAIPDSDFDKQAVLNLKAGERIAALQSVAVELAAALRDLSPLLKSVGGTIADRALAALARFEKGVIET